MIVMRLQLSSPKIRLLQPWLTADSGLVFVFGASWLAETVHRLALTRPASATYPAEAYIIDT